MIGKFMLEI